MNVRIIKSSHRSKKGAYVQLRNRRGGKSRHMTVEGMTAAELQRLIELAVRDRQKLAEAG